MFNMVEEDEITKWFDENYEGFMVQFMKMERPFILDSEITIANGQQVDKVVYGTGKQILALVECKGTTNLTEFLRGVSQAYQQNHQINLNLNDNISSNAKSFLVMPADMLESNIDFNRFDLEGFTLVFVDIVHNTCQPYDANDHVQDDLVQWVNVSPNWFRDCSLPGLYFMLKLVATNTGLRRSDRIAKNQMHDKVKDFMKEHDKLFFNDVRNNLITTSKLGFWDERTLMLTDKGLLYVKKNFHDFCKTVVLEDLGEYSRAVFLAIVSLKGKCSTSDIADKIEKTFYMGKKVKYLHDDDGGHRNIGTIIRMLETIGAMKRISQSEIRINYAPLRGMPFRMKEFNGEKITGDDYNDRIKFWFDGFNFDFDY